MKKFFLIIVIFLFIGNVKAIDTSATSAILMDMDSNRILYAENIHKVRSVASISKIMTAILAIENTDIKKKVVIGDEIDHSYGSGIYIKKGEELTIEDLLYGLMLRSGNDASYAIAKNTFGSIDSFVVKMNELAANIGMKNTEFNNPNGLDEEEGNFSTAYDMALLTSYANKNEIYRKIVSTKKYTLKTNMNTYIWHNKNKLLSSYEYTTGGKTGFTVNARRTLVTTASKNNLNLVAVTLNDGNDFNDHKNLFEYGFNNYKKHQILKSGTLTIDDDYYRGYELYINGDFWYPLAKDEEDGIKVEYELKKEREFKNDMIVGKTNVYLYDKKIYSTDIYLKVNEQKQENVSIFTKIKEWFLNLW